MSSRPPKGSCSSRIAYGGSTIAGSINQLVAQQNYGAATGDDTQTTSTPGSETLIASCKKRLPDVDPSSATNGGRELIVGFVPQPHHGVAPVAVGFINDEPRAGPATMQLPRAEERGGDVSPAVDQDAGMPCRSSMRARTGGSQRPSCVR